MITNILIVDDSAADRQRLEKLLTVAGYKAISAENGLLGVEAAKNTNPDVVLMDVNMPEMDGFAATRTLKNSETTKGIPVILVTAKDQKADKAWGKMLGANGYITKPYTDEEVLNVISAL